MSAELVRQDSGEIVPVGEGIDDWVQMLGSVGELARNISTTPFVPESFRGSTAAVAAAILTGRELGIPPMLALRHVHVIKGKPGMSAELMRLLVQRAGHEIEVVEATDTRCLIKGRRRGDDQQWQEASFTADQARRAKIDLGGYPEDKLVARATTRLCRRMFADVIGGMPTVEELENGDPDGDTGRAGQGSALPATPARRTAQRKGRGVTTATRSQAAAAPRAAAPEPDLDDDTVDAEAVDEGTVEATEVAVEAAGSWSDDEGGEPSLDEPGDGEEKPDPAGPPSEAQAKALHAALNGIGYKGGRDAKLDLLSVLVERELSSSTELTRSEVGGLLDLLAFFARQDDPLAALRVSYDEAKARRAAS